MTYRRLSSTIAALAVAAVGCACGPVVSTSHADVEKARLQWTACMRQHGVDIPDPGQPASGSTPSNEATSQAAQQTCDPILRRVGAGSASTPDPAVMDSALRFAACMRQHGVDVPDPRWQGGGVEISFPHDVDRNSPSVQQAQQACGPFLTDRAR